MPSLPPPSARVRPSGLNATALTALPLPVVKGWPSGRGCAGSATFHSRTVPSSLPLARVRPSGLNATARTGLLLLATNRPLVRGWPSGRGCAGSATFHSRTVPSTLPLARVRPSGLNATAKTGASLPLVRGWPSGRGCAGSVTFHSRTVPSSLPLARVRPSGLNATALTASAGAGQDGQREGSRAGCTVVVAAGQGVAVGAERHRIDGVMLADGQGLAERLGVRGVGDVPQPDRAVAVAAGQGVAIGAERHRVDDVAAADGQGLAERPGVRGVGDVPQPDRTVGVAAGQGVAIGAERHRTDEDAAAAGQGLAERPGVRRVGDIPQPDRAARRCCRWPACGHRG